MLLLEKLQEPRGAERHQVRRAPWHPASPPPPLPWGSSRCPTLSMAPSPPLGCGCSSTGLLRWAGVSVPCRPFPRARSSASKSTLRLWCLSALLTPRPHSDLLPPSQLRTEPGLPLPEPEPHVAPFLTHCLDVARLQQTDLGLTCSLVCPRPLYLNSPGLIHLTCKVRIASPCASPPLWPLDSPRSVAFRAEKPLHLL